MAKQRTSLAHLSQKPERRPETAETPSESVKVVQVSEAPKTQQAPSRAGKTQVTGYFPPEVRRQLKMIATEEDRSAEQLLGEALNMLFASRGRVEFPSIQGKESV